MCRSCQCGRQLDWGWNRTAVPTHIYSRQAVKVRLRAGDVLGAMCRAGALSQMQVQWRYKIRGDLGLADLIGGS